MERVKTYRFYKTDYGSWYIDLPEWEGLIGELQMVAGADTLLDEVSGGNKEVFIEVAGQQLPGFETLQRVQVKEYGGAD